MHRHDSCQRSGGGVVEIPAEGGLKDRSPALEAWGQQNAGKIEPTLGVDLSEGSDRVVWVRIDECGGIDFAEMERLSWQAIMDALALPLRRRAGETVVNGIVLAREAGHGR